MAVLGVNPLRLDFGSSAVPATLNLIVSDHDPSVSIIITSITSDNPKFVPTFTPPLSVFAQGGTFAIPIVYTPTGAGTDTGTLTILSDSDGSPTLIALTAISVSSGKAISVSPPSFVFPATKAGQTSGNQVWAITNTGFGNVTIQIPVVTAPFVGVALPGAPTVLTPLQTLNFQINFQPSGGGYVANATGLVITSDAPSSPNNVDLEGQGVLITPAYTVAGGTDSTYVAFKNTVMKFNPADLNCESPAFAERTFVLAGPGVEARVLRLELQYEDKGSATVNVKITGDHIDPTTGQRQTVNQTVAIGSNAADNTIAHALADLGVEGEIAVIRMTPAGPLSLLAYIPRFVPGGEVTK